MNFCEFILVFIFTFCFLFDFSPFFRFFWIRFARLGLCARPDSRVGVIGPNFGSAGHGGDWISVAVETGAQEFGCTWLWFGTETRGIPACSHARSL